MVRRIRLVLLAAIVAVFASLVAGPASAAGPTGLDRIHDRLLRHDPGAPLLIAAHRGQWRDAPENSLAAIRHAIADGAEIVEIDVRPTRDGHLVLMHDETVNRTTNGTGKVSELTLAQVKSLRLKKGLGGAQAPLTSHTVPTFEEAMLAVKDRAMVNLDKGWPVRERMYEVLRRTGTVDHGLFKGSPTVAEAAAFMAKDPAILYMHMVDETADLRFSV